MCSSVTYCTGLFLLAYIGGPNKIKHFFIFSASFPGLPNYIMLHMDVIDLKDVFPPNFHEFPGYQLLYLLEGCSLTNGQSFPIVACSSERLLGFKFSSKRTKGRDKGRPNLQPCLWASPVVIHDSMIWGTRYWWWLFMTNRWSRCGSLKPPTNVEHVKVVGVKVASSRFCMPISHIYIYWYVMPAIKTLLLINVYIYIYTHTLCIYIYIWMNHRNHKKLYD